MKQNKHMRSIYTPFHLSKLKMKLFGFPLKGSGSISISEDTPCVDDGGGKKFKCRYCRRQFANSQALVVALASLTLGEAFDAWLNL